jgi:hypothetical protein
MIINSTGASSTSPGCFLGSAIVSMISARFYDQRRLVMHRVHWALAFRSALKTGDRLFTPPEVVPAGGGLL